MSKVICSTTYFFSYFLSSIERNQNERCSCST
nr:MAG TPA: hypothetical protein [Caudoviricetes sp.]